MQDNPFVIALWLVSAAVTVLAAVLAGRSRQARYVGRGAVAALFVVGGALVGRLTRLSYAGVIAFYSALWVFGPEILFVAVMLPAMLLLLRAEWRATARSEPRSSSDRLFTSSDGKVRS